MKSVKIRVFLKGNSPSIDISETAVVVTDGKPEFQINDPVEFEDPFIAGKECKGKINNIDSFTDEDILYVVINVVKS